MSQTQTIASQQTTQLQDAAYSKVTWRWIPFLLICYMCSYLDRANVGFAKLQMLSDLHLSETVYGLGAGIFYIGYLVFEVPSNVILHRVGARMWIARIMITWGIISGSMMFVRGELSFYVLRFLLGAAEAGFFPGIILYLSYWYPSERRAKITALFMTAIPVSLVFGGLVSGWIMRSLSGLVGLPGWQWLFLAEAAPSVIIGIIVLCYLDDGIRSSKWLSEDEKQLLESNIEKGATERKGHTVGSAFGDGKVWLLAIMYYCLNMGIGLVVFWLPTIIKGMGIKDPFHIGLMTCIPYSVTIVCMILVARSADKYRERRWHLAIPACLGGIALGLSTACSGHTLLAMLALTVGSAGLFASLPVFWNLPTSFLGGVAAAAGIAIVNSIGNFSAFSSTFFIGWIKDMTHSMDMAMYGVAFLGILGGLLVFVVPSRLVDK